MKLPTFTLCSALRQTLLQSSKLTPVAAAKLHTVTAQKKTIVAPRTNHTLYRNCFQKHCGSNISEYKMLCRIPFSPDFFLRQLFDNETFTYSYLLADLNTNEAVLIDPVLEQAKRDAALIKELGFTLKYSLNTHMHADHITGSGWLKELLPGSKSAIAKSSGAKADIHLYEGDKVEFGRHSLKALSTPGHTNGCMSYVIEEQGCVFTGDALFVRGCGRTDFQEGSPEVLYKSVHEKIFTLPENFKIYPGHDYRGQLESTVWEEKKYNPRLTKNLDEFIKIMDNLNLAYPNKIDVAIPANRECGVYDIPKE